MAVGDISENPLFSQTKMIGSFQTEARFIDSWKAPWATAPSPKNAATTAP